MKIEDAIKNVQIVLESFVGTKQQHVTLEISLQTIISNLKKDEDNKSDKK